MALLSTNAFADAGDKYATTVYRYQVIAEPAGEVPGTAKILGYVAGYTDVATTKIPATVAHPTNSKINYNVIEIAADAFAGNANITAIDLTEATNLTTIPTGAFVGTKIASLDLSKTKVAAIARLFTKAAADPDPAVTNATLKTVVLPATVATIAESAFEDCTVLNSITFAALTSGDGALPNVGEIGAFAFKKTALTALDLTNTKILTLNELFETLNTNVTTVKLPATLKIIGENAFTGLSALTSIDFSACKALANIKAYAFKNTMALTKLELPATLELLEVNAFANSYFTELTINANTKEDVFPVIQATGAPKVTKLTVKGDFKGEFKEGAFTSLTEVSFGGKLAAGALKAGSFAANTKLATVTFSGDLAAGAVAEGAFKNNGTALTVTYAPTTAGENKESFAQNAFAAADADEYVTFNTTTHYGETTLATLVADGKGNVLYGVKLKFTASPDEPDGTIKVANKTGVSASYYYASWTAPTGGVTIPKKQGADKKVDVMVYGAYVDNAAATAILMDQLHLMNGNYYLPEGSKVIVKSSSSDPVEYIKGNDGNDSRNYKVGGAGLQSEILTYDGPDDETFAATVIDANPTKKVYFLAPIEDYGFLWSPFKENRVIAKGQFYLLAEPTAAAAPRIIWLDGSEADQTTGIQEIGASVKNDGAIYNLSGQKVSGSYKGIIIKDGKKYIQK